MEILNVNNRKKTRKGITPSEIHTLLGKVPPQALDLEEAVLGAILIDKESLSKISDFLRPEAFYLETNQKIFQAILSLFLKSEPVDIRTVTNELRYTGELEFVGGAHYIASLTLKIASSANVEYHSRILQQYAIKRKIISIAALLQRDAFEDTIDVFDLLDSAQSEIFKVSEQMEKKSYSKADKVLQAALKEIEEKRKHKDGLTGVPSGFTDLDRMTSGWQKSDLVIVAARPAMGKTAFVLSLIRNASVDYGKTCAIFSLEMSSVQLMLRLISSEAEIESEKIKKGQLEEHEWVELTKKVSGLSKSKLYIDDTPALSILELRSKCRRLKSNGGLDLVVIDYLQLMNGENPSKNGSGNREQEISYISRSLKGLAKELEVPVIALSQLSRATEQRGGSKIPQLSDLRESGSIEQDADIVIFLYRPEYYGLTEYEDGIPASGTGQVIIAKHRNGPVDKVTLKYIAKFTKFKDNESTPNDWSTGYTSISNLDNENFKNIKGNISNGVILPSKNWDNNDKNQGFDLGSKTDYDPMDL